VGQVDAQGGGSQGDQAGLEALRVGSLKLTAVSSTLEPKLSRIKRYNIAQKREVDIVVGLLKKASW